MTDLEAKSAEELSGCRAIESEATGMVYFIGENGTTLAICGMPVNNKPTKVKLSKNQVLTLCWKLPQIVDTLLGWKRVSGPKLTDKHGDYCRDRCGEFRGCKRLKSGNRCKDALMYDKLKSYEWSIKEETD